MSGIELMPRFMVELARVESNFRYDVQNATSAAMGRYQILAANWSSWAPRALDWEGLPIAGKDIAVDLWQPPTTPYNQEQVAIWEVNRIFRVQGDWRRVAASWRSGRSVGRQQPAVWTSGTLKYVNGVCGPLGFEPVTAETVLPPLPSEVTPEPAPEPIPEPPPEPDPHMVLIEKVDELLSRVRAENEAERLRGRIGDYLVSATTAMDQLRSVL